MVKKKECYTKKKNDGGSYTTCVEGQKKPKTIKIKRKKKVVKPKKTAPKKLLAGKAVLMGLPINMKIIGQYAIPKKEKERREQVKITKLNKQLTAYSTRVINATHRYKKILKENDMPTIKKELKKAIKMKKKYEDLKKDYKTLAKTNWKPPGTVKEFGDFLFTRWVGRAKQLKVTEPLLKDFITKATVRSKGIKNIDASAGGKVLLGGGGAVMRRIGSFAIKNPFRDNKLNIKDFFRQFKEFERKGKNRDTSGHDRSNYRELLRTLQYDRTGGYDYTVKYFMDLWDKPKKFGLDDGRHYSHKSDTIDLAFKLIGQWANSSTYGKYIKTSYSYDDMKALMEALVPLVNDIEEWKEASRLTYKERVKENEKRWKKRGDRGLDMVWVTTAEPRAAIKGVNKKTGGTWPFKILGENHSTHGIQGGFTGKTVTLVNLLKVWPQLVSKYGWNGNIDGGVADIIWRSKEHGSIYLINLKSSMASRKKLVNIIKT